MLDRDAIERVKQFICAVANVYYDFDTETALVDDSNEEKWMETIAETTTPLEELDELDRVVQSILHEGPHPHT